jgi:hypothetical protein
MSSRTRVFSAYRSLFRARKSLFKADHQAMRESRVAIKDEFVKNQAAPTSGDHFEGLISAVDEAVDMLRHGIVQGNLNQDSGHYEVKFEPEHVDGPDMRVVEPITEETVAKLQKPMVETTKSKK